MAKLEIEFTNDTLVATENGVERLADLLKRPVVPCLWAVKWRFEDRSAGYTFHRSHKLAREFIEKQVLAVRDGPIRLVDVSKKILDCVQEHSYCWAGISNLSEAATYEGETWKY